MQQPETVTAVAGDRPWAGAPGDWLTPGRFALVLAMFILAAFPQVLLGWETFVIRDYGFFSFPVAHYQRECFWRGALPLWDPYNNCGVPFLAQWNTMSLYPPALLYLLLPLTWSLSFFCLVHLFWAGWGMYFLARRWTGNNLAASVAGVLFAFNGLSLNLLMWPSHIATLSWMPWVVLCVERGWREGGRRLIWGALVGSLQMLAGGPESILFTWLILCALWLMQWVRALRKAPDASEGSRAGVSAARSRELGANSAEAPITLSAGAMAWRFPLMVLLVAGLAAAQLVPFLDLAVHSQREEGFADTRWSMPGRGWANFLVPMVFGSTWKQNLFFQYGQYWTSSYYLGIGTLLVALFALGSVRDRRVWLLAGASAIALLLAGGDNNVFSRVARRLIPQLSLMTYPVKYVIVAVFAIPLLAGFGVGGFHGAREEHARGTGTAREKRLGLLALMLLLLIGGILFWARGWPLEHDDFSATWRNGVSRAGFLLVATALLVGLGRVERPLLQRLLPLLLLAVFWLDVWTHEPNQNPSVPTWVYADGLAHKELAMDPQPMLGRSRAMVSRTAETKFMQLVLNDPKDNFLAKRLGYFADCNLLDGVPKVNGFFSIYPRECGELNSVLYVSTNDCPPRLADFMAVSQLTAPDDYVKWRPRSTFLPLATAGQQPVFLDDTNALSLLIGPDFDGRKFVFLPPEARSMVSVTHATQARVLRQQFRPEVAELEVEAAENALVVVSQTYFHRWRAYVDEKPAPLLRANYAFQAVQVPSGKHSIRLAYEDGGLRAGLCISGVSLLICVLPLAAKKFGKNMEARK